MSEMQMGQGFAGVIDRVRAEGQLTRNSGTNSLKRLTDTVNLGNELSVDAFSDLNNMMETKLDMLYNILSLESNETGLARMQAQDAAMKAEAFYMNLLQLNKQGVDNTEALAAAQEGMFEEQRKANELSEKKGLFDRLDDKEPAAKEETGSGKSLADTLKKIRNRTLGLGTILLLAAGALLALFEDAFNSVSEILDDFIEGDFAKGFAKIGDALDRGLTNILKNVFGLQFEGTVSDVIKTFIGDFIAGIADLLPDIALFREMKKNMLATAAQLSPKVAARLAADQAADDAAREALKKIDDADESGGVQPAADAFVRRTQEEIESGGPDVRVITDPKPGNRLRDELERIKKDETLTEEQKKELKRQAIRGAALERAPELQGIENDRELRRLIEEFDPFEDSPGKEDELVERIQKERDSKSRLQDLLDSEKLRNQPVRRGLVREEISNLNMELAQLREELFKNRLAQNALEDESGGTAPMIQNNVDASNNTGGATNIQSNGRPTNNHSPAGRFGAAIEGLH